MALKSFFVRGRSSGRSTAVEGGPKLSNKESSMDVSYFQCENGEQREIVRIQSEQYRRHLATKVTIYTKNGPREFEIETRY